MSDYPSHARYRITASKLGGEPVATLRRDGDGQPIKWELLQTGNDEQIWYFEPHADNDSSPATYYIRNAKYPTRYLEFGGEPKNGKPLLTQSSVHHVWRVDKLETPNSFKMYVSHKETSYFIVSSHDGGLILREDGWLNLYFELVQ